MKTRIFLFCIAFLAYIPLANAWNEEAMDKINSRLGDSIYTINENTKKHDQRLAGIDKSIKELQFKIEILSKRISDIDGKPPISNPTLLPSWVLVIMVVACAIIVAFAGLLFWPRKTRVYYTETSSLKCPRCGWEHDPGATVCKNPKCRCKF